MIKYITCDNITFELEIQFIQLIPLLYTINNLPSSDYIPLHCNSKIFDIILNFIKLNNNSPIQYCNSKLSNNNLIDNGFPPLLVKYIQSFELLEILDIMEFANYFKIDFLIYLCAAQIAILFKLIGFENIFGANPNNETLNSKDIYNNNIDLFQYNNIIYFNCPKINYLFDFEIPPKKYHFNNFNILDSKISKLIDDFKILFNDNRINFIDSNNSSYHYIYPKTIISFL